MGFAVLPSRDNVVTCSAGELALSAIEHICVPGAKISITDPKLEVEALESVISEEPTVMTSRARAGDTVLALTLLLPAATAVVIPALTSLEIALSMAEETGDSKLKETTAGPLRWFLMTQSAPEMTSAPAAAPESLITLTATTLAFLATPLYGS